MDREIYELSREAHRDDCSREAYKMYYQALEAKIAWMEQEAHAASATIERLREALHSIERICSEDGIPHEIRSFRAMNDARAALEGKE